MGFGKGILLYFLSSLLVLSLVLLGILWSLHSFLYPTIYEKILNDSGVYNTIENSVSQFPEIQFIEMPSGGIPSLVNELIGNALSYIRGETPTLNLTVGIDTQKVTDMVTSSIGSLPPGINITYYIDQVLQQYNIPVVDGNRVDLASLAGINQSELEPVIKYVKDYQYALYGTFALSLLLVILIFFISDSRTRWSGIDFAASGLLLFIMAYFTFPMAISLLSQQLSFVPVPVQPIIKDIFGLLSSRIEQYSFAIAGIGVLGIVISLFLKKKETWEDNQGKQQKAKPENGLKKKQFSHPQQTRRPQRQ